MLFQGLYWGGNSDASERASKEEQISSSGIEDRSCWTGEPAGTGSPAENLQLNESHLAGILDDIYVSDSASWNKIDERVSFKSLNYGWG